MKCRRTACQSDNAVCRHSQTGDMYCPRCARKINEHNPGLVAWPVNTQEDRMQLDRIIAASPIINPGKGCNNYRVVLKAGYNQYGQIEQFVVTRQYLLHADEQLAPGSVDTLSWGNGEYFNVYLGGGKPDHKPVLEKAFARFQVASNEAMREWPLVDFADYQRFMVALALKEEKNRRDEARHMTYGLPQDGDVLCDGRTKGSPQINPPVVTD